MNNSRLDTHQWTENLTMGWLERISAPYVFLFNDKKLSSYFKSRTKESAESAFYEALFLDFVHQSVTKTDFDARKNLILKDFLKKFWEEEIFDKILRGG